MVIQFGVLKQLFTVQKPITLFQVTLCRNLLIKEFYKKKCASWRNLCSTIIGESVSTKYFLLAWVIGSGN